MLRIHDVRISLGGRQVLHDVSFIANDGAPVGIVGANGSGKTTLLRVVAGELTAQAGSIEASPGVRIGYLRQGYAGRERDPICSVFPNAIAAAPAEVELERVAAELARATDEERRRALDDRFAELLALIEAGDGRRAEVEAMRDALRLGVWSTDTPVGSLSGGELAKLALVDLFAAAPDAVLLDEPTNHLDLEALEWLEARVREFRGPAVIVSHDRAFLDATATSIVALDAAGRAEVFAGNYSAYAEEAARREQEQLERYERQERERGRLLRSIHEAETRSRGIEQQTIHFHYRKRALKVARRAVTLRSRLQRQLESSEHVERPSSQPRGLRASAIAGGPRASSRLVEAHGVAVAAGGRELFTAEDFVIRRGQRIVLVGRNGSGKTTLLKALLGQHAPSGGTLSISPSARVGYLPQHDLELLEQGAATPVEAIRRAVDVGESEAFNLLHRFLFGHDRAATPLRALSYGERRRLSLARLILGGANLLLLDEPTNHLDLPSRESFEAALESFEGAWIAVTHDRYFAERLAEEVWAIDAGRLRPAPYEPLG